MVPFLVQVVSIFSEIFFNLKQQGAHINIQMAGAVYQQNYTPWIQQNCAVIEETPSLGVIAEVKITTTYRMS